MYVLCKVQDCTTEGIERHEDFKDTSVSARWRVPYAVEENLRE